MGTEASTERSSWIRSIGMELGIMPLADPKVLKPPAPPEELDKLVEGIQFASAGNSPSRRETPEQGATVNNGVAEAVEDLASSVVEARDTTVSSVATEGLNERLFNALREARYFKGRFETGELVYELCLQSPDLLPLVAEQLAKPYANDDKRVGAVIGMGLYGDRLAQAITQYLPRHLVIGTEATQFVSSFPIEKSDGQWHFASEQKVGQKLRAKHVLVVLPVFTESTAVDVEAVIRYVTDHLGTNTTVVGVVAVYALNVLDRWSTRSHGKTVPVEALVSLNFK